MWVLVTPSSIPQAHNLEGRNISGSRKSRAVANWPDPKNVSEVRSFLSLARYYQRFVPNFAKIASPLTKLTRKETRYQWTPECETSFQKLKDKLTDAPILALPNEFGSYVVYTDASKNGLGAVLMQDGKVIAYASWQLKECEKISPPMT